MAAHRLPFGAHGVAPLAVPNPVRVVLFFLQQPFGLQLLNNRIASGESIEGNATYRERTVAYQDISPAGMRAKAKHVLEVMEARMRALGFSWADTTDLQVYTVHDIFDFLPDEIVRRGAARNGATWHFARPPVIDLEFELDCRGIDSERVLGR